MQEEKKTTLSETNLPRKNKSVGKQIQHLKQKYKAILRGKEDSIWITYYSSKRHCEVTDPLSWGWVYGKIKWFFKRSQWKAPHPGALTPEEQTVFEKQIPSLMKILQEAKIKGNIKPK